MLGKQQACPGITSALGEPPSSAACSCRLSSLGWQDEDGSSERFWSARSRAGSTASSIYLDAESELGLEVSYELTPARSGALAQMQVPWGL